ncbi:MULTISPECIES: nucleotide excision repair endonuclease [Bacillales]
MREIRRLRTKKEKVEYILQHYPETRVTDRLLVLTYWRHFDNITKIDDCVKATSSETITRLRRLLNENGKYVVSDEDRRALHTKEQEKENEFRRLLEENAFDDGFISIKAPSVRKTLHIDLIRADERALYDLKSVGGVYVFYDMYSNPLYVGISKDLHTRMQSHINEVSTNKRLRELMRAGIVHRVDFMYVSNVYSRDIYETYLIKSLRPFCNLGKTNKGRTSSEQDDILQEYKDHINEIRSA